MNLLVIAPHYKYFIKNQVEALAQYFSEIHIAIRYNPLTELSPFIQFWSKSEHFKKYSKKNLVDYTNLPENVKIHLIPIYYFIPDGSNKSIGNKIFNKMGKWIDKGKINFDLIHAHFTWPFGYIGVRLKQKYGKPVIITIHENSEWFNHEVNKNQPFITMTWSNADALIRVNRKDVPILKRYNKMVYAIPNGFSPSFQQIDKTIARKNLTLPLDVKIIFSLGNLIKRKGFNYLIDAIKQVCKYQDNLICFIGGAGPEQRSLQKQIDRLNIRDKVKLLGFVSNESLPLWMNAADIFVLPSLSESFGIVQIEAMACGKPVVATRNDGSEEIITSEDYGLLVEPGNADDLAEKILIALDKEWDREKIRKYAEQFTWENIAKEIVKISEQIME